MEQLTVVNFLLAFGAFLIHALISVQTALAEKKTNFIFGKWIQENWISGVVSIIAIVILLVTAEDITKMFNLKIDPDSSSYKMYAVVTGYMGRDLLYRLIGWAQARINSKSGGQ